MVKTLGRLGAGHLRLSSSGLGQTNRALSRAHGQTNRDTPLTGATCARGITPVQNGGGIFRDSTRSEWIRWALRPAGDCISAVAECSIIAACTLAGAVTRTE